MKTFMRLLLLIILVDFGDQLLQQYLYSPEPLPNIIATGTVMLLGVFLAEAGRASLWMSPSASLMKIEDRHTERHPAQTLTFSELN
jgi:hypothetical protein